MAEDLEAAVESAPFDPEVPSIARTYDYLIGGKDNFPADRELGEVFIRDYPGAVQIALDNRACLVRAVAYIAGDLGIAQFLDLGSGLPTADNVHQVAQRVNPAARVAYVDKDPVVLVHGRALLEEDDQTIVVNGDIVDPALLDKNEIRELLDFDRPIAIIASAVLHHLNDDEDPHAVIGRLCGAAPTGSCLFVSHFRSLEDPDSVAFEAVLKESLGRGTWRADEQIASYFDGMTLIEPGIVPCAAWHPGTAGAALAELTHYQRLIVAGLGRK
jgi:hypothetical protein